MKLSSIALRVIFGLVGLGIIFSSLLILFILQFAEKSPDRDLVSISILLVVAALGLIIISISIFEGRKFIWHVFVFVGAIPCIFVCVYIYDKYNPSYDLLSAAIEFDNLNKVESLLDKTYELNLGVRFHESAKFGRTDIMDLLIKRGVPIDIYDSEGCTALYNTLWTWSWDIGKPIEKRYKKTVVWLITNGAQVDALIKEISLPDGSSLKPKDRSAEEWKKIPSPKEPFCTSLRRNLAG